MTSTRKHPRRTAAEKLLRALDKIVAATKEAEAARRELNKGAAR